MRKARDTIKQQIARIKRSFKQRDLATGMLYNQKRQLTTKMKKITLWGLFVSDENTFLVRPHVFESHDGRNAAEWNAWMQREYGTILREDLLPGMENRTGKQWRLYRVIGWANANSRTIRAKTRKKRNKTKSKRRQNGRNRTRRG